MSITNMYQAKTQLSQLIEKALAGEEVVIAKAGKPLVKLTPVTIVKKTRQGGRLKGKITIPPDFDAEDPEIIEMFYGKDTT